MKLQTARRRNKIPHAHYIPTGRDYSILKPSQMLKVLLEKAVPDEAEVKPAAVIADQGYDSQGNCRLVFKEYGAAPIIPIRERDDMQQPDICNAKGTPTCGCGLEMIYWGRDGNYLKYRCPEAVGKGKCRSRFRCTSSPYGYVLKLPILTDPRRHPPVPRETRKWRRLYRLRGAIDRVNSRAKELLGLGRITVRGIAKVTVRALLSLLVMLAIDPTQGIPTSLSISAMPATRCFSPPWTAFREKLKLY